MPLPLAPLPQGVGNSDLQPLILQINDRLRRISTALGPGEPGDKGPPGPEGSSGPEGPRGPAGNQGGITMIEEIPTGTINGTNKVFTLSEAPEDILILFVNGIQQYKGTDFTLSALTITYTIAPLAGDWHLAVYDSSSPGTGGLMQEIPQGVIDANNTVFTLTEAPAGFCLLFLNGVEQLSGTDFSLNGATITYQTPPQSGDNHVAVYGTTNPGADAPGKDRDVVYNRQGKFAADDWFQYDYSQQIVSVIGGANTGFTAHTFNSYADSDAVPANARAFATSGNKAVIYGDGRAIFYFIEIYPRVNTPPALDANVAGIYYNSTLQNLFYNAGAGWIPFGGTILNAITVTTTPYNLATTDALVTLGPGAGVVNFPQQSQIVARHVFYIANRSGADCALVPFSGDTLGGRSSFPIPNGANYEFIVNA